MKFWQSFSKKSVMRQFFFVLFIFALLIPFALWDSNTQVKVSFDTDLVYVICDQFNMSIRYTDIVSAELTELGDPGEKVLDGYDNDIVRFGTWKNDVWGEYVVVADPDTSKCVLLKLEDGRTLVFSRKDDKATEEDYTQLLTYLE